MTDKMNKENTYQTSVRMPRELYEKITEMANKNERKPAEQIRFMLKEYIEFKEK